MLVSTSTDIVKFAHSKWKDAREFEIRDAYKWLYQATLGGEHAVIDAERSRSRLLEEWNMLGDAALDEKLWEPLRPDKAIGRLHLRPFRHLKGSIDDINTAFIASSQEHIADHNSFIETWCELGEHLRLVLTGDLSFFAWTAFDAEIKVLNYPAISHSESYRHAHRPAYRILTKSEADKLLKLYGRELANSG